MKRSMMIQKANKRYDRISIASKKQLVRESDSVLDELQKESAGKLPGMDYFYGLARSYSRGELVKQDKKKYIATSCVQVPIELIYAAGAVPVRTCSGSHSMSQAGAEFLPAKSCSLVSATFGTIYTDSIHVPSKPIAIINPTTCDQKKKLSEIPSGMDIPYYTLELPPTKDSEEAQMYWYSSVKKFSRDLEGITGKRITRNRLKAAILKVARAQQAFRQLHQIRKEHPSIRGTDAILIANTFFYDDIDSWTQHVDSLNHELAKGLQQDPGISDNNAPRILLTGSPSIFPNFKLPIMIEAMGGHIVADEFCSSNRLLYDTVAVDEWNMYDMIPALADRYLKACTCPCFTPNQDRDRKLLSYIKDFRVDGLVYQSFSGCQLYEMESNRIASLMEQENIPMLYIETDYSPDDRGQLSTRIEAFIESLSARKQLYS
jgi:benzoyl-CoA reductase/2-hydroxyglutaryl-CoA dehydratase subunit BcrC/BadD/HgdB